MKANPLVIITTRLPPAACGIGTYSWLLQKHWPNGSEAVEFLVIDGASTLDRATNFNANTAQLARELKRIGTADVLLHYAGRAYQRFGCPVGLPQVLAKWKGKFRGARLMILFHELPGQFPPISRHFWLGKLNSWIIRRLASLADVVITNTGTHVAKLREISGRTDIHFLPVGSNIESSTESPSPRLRTEFLIFGLPFGRWQTLERFQIHIRRWQAEGRLTKLHLIGPDQEPALTELDPSIIVRHGMLPSTEVAALLGRFQFALTNVSEETWSKSGAFMACAANKCPVIIASERSGAIPFSYAIGADEVGAISDEEIARRTAGLAEWYHANADWPVTAARVASLFDRAGA